MNDDIPTFEEFNNLNESLDSNIFVDVIDEAKSYSIESLTEDDLLGGVVVTLVNENDVVIATRNFVSEEVAKVYLEELWDMQID